MKRIVPDDIYKNLPCGIVAVGCALGADGRETALINHILGCALSGVYGPKMKRDGYLSLKGLNALIRANMGVKKQKYFKQSERIPLRDFAHANEGRRAIVCVLGHYVYFDGHDHYSFFKNGGDEVVCAWYLE